MDELERIEQTIQSEEPIPVPETPQEAFVHPGTEPDLDDMIPSGPEAIPVDPVPSDPAQEPLPEEIWTEPAAGEQCIPDPVPETFGQSLDREERVPYAVPLQNKSRKKKKKTRSGVGVLATVLLCLLSALLGGLLGGHLVKRSIPDPEPAQMQSDPTMESRIAALEEAARKAPQQQAYDAQVPVTTTQVYEDNVSSVVGIMNEGKTTNVFGQTAAIASSGSGFIIREDGYIVTNCHVIENAESLRVSLYNGHEYQAVLVGSDADFDVAVLKIEAEDLDAVTIGDSDLLRVGDQVAAIGNPLGELTLSMTVGYISARDRELNTDGRPMNMLQTDVAINSGNSGGPLFDMKGNVIGITTAKYSGSTSSGASIEGIGFALPINDVMGIVNDLMELGYVSGQAYLGVTTMEMDSRTAQMYSLPMGVYISSVTKGSCAEKAGIQKGDIILKLGGQETTTYTALRRALRTYSPGDTTTITVYRAGAEMELTVTLDERPSEEEIANAEKAGEVEPQPEQPQEEAGDRSGTEQEQTPEQTPEEQPGQQQGGGFAFPGGDIDEWFRYFFGG